MPRGSKPGERRGGRQKGTPNKLTTDLKEMILGALSGAGGQDYLTRQAETNPVAFMALLGRVLPMTLAGDKDNPPVVGIVRVPWKDDADQSVGAGPAKPLPPSSPPPYPVETIEPGGIGSLSRN